MNILEAIRADVQLQGLALQGVFGQTPFTYTIGVAYSLGHPELIISGFPPSHAAQYLSYAYHCIKKAGFKFKHGQRLDNFDCDPSFVVIQCDRRVFETHLCQAKFFYESIHWDQPLVPPFQLVWCDKAGRYPWDEGYDQQPHAAGSLQPVHRHY